MSFTTLTTGVRICKLFLFDNSDRQNKLDCFSYPGHLQPSLASAKRNLTYADTVLATINFLTIGVWNCKTFLFVNSDKQNKLECLYNASILKLTLFLRKELWLS
jgi:hypothetical protein